jgi:hypothetical protein
LIAENPRDIEDTRNKQKPTAKKPRATKNEPVMPQKTPTNSTTLIRSILLFMPPLSLGMEIWATDKLSTLQLIHSPVPLIITALLDVGFYRVEVSDGSFQDPDCDGFFNWFQRLILMIFPDLLSQADDILMQFITDGEYIHGSILRVIQLLETLGFVQLQFIYQVSHNQQPHHKKGDANLGQGECADDKGHHEASSNTCCKYTEGVTEGGHFRGHIVSLNKFIEVSFDLIDLHEGKIELFSDLLRGETIFQHVNNHLVHLFSLDEIVV